MQLWRRVGDEILAHRSRGIRRKDDPHRDWLSGQSRKNLYTLPSTYHRGATISPKMRCEFSAKVKTIKFLHEFKTLCVQRIAKLYLHAHDNEELERGTFHLRGLECTLDG